MSHPVHPMVVDLSHERLLELLSYDFRSQAFLRGGWHATATLAQAIGQAMKIGHGQIKLTDKL